MTSTVVVGGSGGVGRVIARHFADRGDDVTITSREKARAEAVAAVIGPGVAEHVGALRVDVLHPGLIGDSPKMARRARAAGHRSGGW